MERPNNFNRLLALTIITLSASACNAPNINGRVFIASGAKTQNDVYFWADFNGQGISVQGGIDLSAAELWIFPYKGQYPNGKPGKYLIEFQTP